MMRPPDWFGCPPLILLAALCSAPLPAWQEQPEVTFKANVKVVDLLATVFGKKGEIVRDLSKDDFVLLENGRPQVISYFSRESGLPLTLGLLVDTSVSQHRLIDAERVASFRFLDQVLREDKDQVFVMQFDMGVLVRQGLTPSRKKLEAALTGLKVNDVFWTASRWDRSSS